MNNVLPTLTLDGYLDSVEIMMTKLFEYFVTSEYSQTKLFYTNISSLPYLVRDAGPDLDKLEDSVKETLTKLYSRFWNNVTVFVNVKDKKISSTKHKTIIDIDIEVIHNNRTYTLNKSAEVTDNKVRKLDKKIDYFLGA